MNSSKFNVGYGSSLEGDIHIGKNVKIGNGCFITSEKGRVVIGNDVTIKDRVSIGDNVSIGDGCVLEDGTHIVKNAKIGKRNFFYNCSIGADSQSNSGEQK